MADGSILCADPERQATAARALLCYLAANHQSVRKHLAGAADFRLLPIDARELAAVYAEIGQQAQAAQVTP